MLTAAKLELYGRRIEQLSVGCIWLALLGAGYWQ